MTISNSEDIAQEAAPAPPADPTITIDVFMRKMHDLLTNYEGMWRGQHEVDPEAYPYEMSEDEWFDAFEEFL